MMRHPEQLLSRHIRRRIAETMQNETLTPMDVHGAADVNGKPYEWRLRPHLDCGEADEWAIRAGNR